MRFAGLRSILLGMAGAIACTSVAAAQSTPPAPSPGPQATFTKDVAPILQRACQRCHRPGSIAPMSLLTYQDARPWARSIKREVEARNMPPWHIARGVGITKFKDDPSLTDEEIATIVKWVDAGAPQGNAADMPPPVEFKDDNAWSLGTPDLVVTSRKHEVPAQGSDWWGDYVIETTLTEDRWLRAVEAKPGVGNKQVTHHLVGYLMQDDGRHGVACWTRRRRGRRAVPRRVRGGQERRHLSARHRAAGESGREDPLQHALPPDW